MIYYFKKYYLKINVQLSTYYMLFKFFIVLSNLLKNRGVTILKDKKNFHINVQNNDFFYSILVCPKNLFLDLKLFNSGLLLSTKLFGVFRGFLRYLREYGLRSHTKISTEDIPPIVPGPTSGQLDLNLQPLQPNFMKIYFPPQFF